ncbi:lipase family protein [Xenorhabdus entomophaga]|uniref:lipase family protein n=1 Tax=Xenorhabdus entomophaga TaxID=3136257 RepID=UPI0030F40B82
MFTVNFHDSFASLDLYAATMFDQYPNNLMPPPDPRIEKDGWKLKGYISCNYYSNFTNPQTNKKELIFFDEKVNHGYIVERIKNPGEYVLALRGTKTVAEKMKDLDIDYIYPWPDTPGQAVIDGFHSMYQSLNLVVPDNTTGINYSQLKLADAIAQFIGVNGYFTISGHSLGAAMGTYLMRDIYNKVPHGRACLFASPKVGNYEFVTYVNDHFKDNVVNNYINDLVPKLPPYAEQLPNVNKLFPRDDVKINDTLICNHTILTYLALLNKYKFYDVLNANVPTEHQTWNDCLQVTMDG